MRLDRAPLLPSWPRLATLLAALALTACGDGGGGGDVPDPDGGPDDELGPAFVMMTQVYTADDRNVYFSITGSPDVEPDLADAQEEAGVANFATVGGKLYISDGEAPTITQYDVAADLSLTEGPSLSFAGYTADDNANFYYHYVVDEDRAIMPFDVTSRLIWNPRDMELVGPVEDSSMQLVEDGLILEGGGNRGAVRFANGKAVQPFWYHDEEWLVTGDTSRIALYDPETFAETDVIDAPCPNLELTSPAEDGTTYVGTIHYSPLFALYGDGPAPCLVRIGPDGLLDEAFTTDLTDWTDGRYVVNFRYLQGGKALASVLDHDTLDADFDGPYDPTVDDQLWAGGAYRVWLFDLVAETATPITGVDVPLGPRTQTAVFGDRMFAFATFPDYATTRVYEISDEGVATALYDVPGDVFKWEQLR